MPEDIGRREFLQASGTSLLALSSQHDLELQQTEPIQEYEFGSAAHLIGPASARPTPGGEFFDNKRQYSYVYEDLTGSRSLITDNDSSWQALNYTQQQNVFSSDDLPDPSGGTHTLEDNTAYVFNGFVTSQYGIELGNSTPLIGRHGSLDGFIHTGGATAITGTDAGFFARDLYVHSPGGTLFDLTANVSVEMLVESCSFSDAAGIAEIADLGVIDGYRVPSFKDCNFEDFASGLVFDGSPDKIFFSGCPFRGVSQPGVTILTFVGSLDVDIVDMPDNYVKGVQSDTEVVRVETGGTPNDIFQYRGNTHDSTVTVDNILTGEASVAAVGYGVLDCYPLPDSGVSGEVDQTATGTITGSGAAPTQVTVPTTLNNPERTISPSNGVIQYIGKTQLKVTAHAVVSLSGANSEMAIWIGYNGSIIPRSRVEFFSSNASTPVTGVSVSQIRLDTNDTVSVFVENVGGNSDLDLETLALSI